MYPYFPIFIYQFMSEKMGNENEKTRMEAEFVEMERVRK